MKVHILDVLGSMPHIVRSILSCFSPSITFEFVTEPRTEGCVLLVTDLKLDGRRKVDIEKVLLLKHPLREKEVRSEFKQRLGLYRSNGQWLAKPATKPGTDAKGPVTGKAADSPTTSGRKRARTRRAS